MPKVIPMPMLILARALAGLLLVLIPIMLGVVRPPTQLFVFVLLLNYAMPTAINMSVRAPPGTGTSRCELQPEGGPDPNPHLKPDPNYNPEGGPVRNCLACCLVHCAVPASPRW